MADNILTPQQQNPMAATMPMDGMNTAQGAIPINSMGSVQQTLMRNRRLLLFVAGSLMLAGFMGLMLWSSETPYRPVYSGMDEKDAASVVEFLQKEKIPYRLEGTGTVLIPADQVYNARLQLASNDMMPNSGSGFEIFDRDNSFGVSDFTQKVN
ncbi:MAG: flagellar M-ring protein FliF, partial [Mariprofundaceae bacterium]